MIFDIELVEKFYNESLKQMDIWRELLGTPVKIYSVNTSSYKSAFGSSYSSSFEDDPDVKYSYDKLLINRNDLLNHWMDDASEIEVYDNRKICERGDLIKYESLRLTITFKVERVTQYPDLNIELYVYTLVPTKELKR